MITRDIGNGTNLVFLTTGLSYGGAETQLVRIATGLKARGWLVSVVSMTPPQAYVQELEQAGIPVHSLGMRRGVPDPRALIHLVQILRQKRPIVLITFMYHANLLGRLAGRLARVPVVVSSLRNEHFGGEIRDRIMSLTDWLADVTTINSHLAGDAVIKRGVVTPAKLRVIPNGIDTTCFGWTPELRARIRQELCVESNHFLWLAVGRLEKQKDYHNLLNAFSLVSRERPEAVLYIVGQGSLHQVLDNAVHDMGLQRCVHFLGVRRDIPDLLAAADALVLSSAWEGLPNVVMEAMAAGKPVVATRVGGVPELVKEGRNGFLVPPKDHVALAQAMIRLMDLPNESRVAMGEAGKAYVQMRYNLDQVIDQWEALFLELIRRKVSEG